MNMEIQWEEEYAIIHMDFEYYDYPSLVEAAKEFTDSCFVGIKGAEDKQSIFIRLEIKESDGNLRDIVFSYLNYVLGIVHGKMSNFENLQTI